MKRIPIALAALALAGVLGGCGGSSPTTPRNEADWAEAQQQAQKEIAPLEGVLGVAKAREHERELAKADYEAIMAREHETPQEKKETERGEE